MKRSHNSPLVLFRARRVVWFVLGCLLVAGMSGCHLWGLLTPLAPMPSQAVLEPAASRAAAVPQITPFPTLPPEPPTAPPASIDPDLPAGKIVYTCQVFRDGERNQICLVDAGGSDPKRMTWTDGADHVFPSFAPDGLSFVYSANPTGSYQIYEMDLDGLARQVTDLRGDALAPDVSPDGSRIVFTYKQGDRQTVWTANRDGSDAQPVENPDRGQGWDPVWSPDGSRILFASDRSGSVQLYIVGSDGTGLVQVTEMAGVRGRNDWSPDGTTLATYVGSTWVREIYLMGADGANPRPITSGGNNLAPSFSPDGKWIAFTSYRDKYKNVDGCEIYMMRLGDGAILRLTDNDYCDWQPRWGR